MPEKKELVLEATEKPNCYRYGEYIVEVEFSPDGPSLSEIIQQYIERKLDGLIDGETEYL